MSLQVCPNCGEDEALRGRTEGHATWLRCETCGHSWVRDPRPHCATCDGTNIITRPQMLTAFSRGTQLSVLGWRDVQLCLTCDIDAVRRSTGAGAPLPQDYESAAEHPRPAAT